MARKTVQTKGIDTTIVAKGNVPAKAASAVLYKLSEIKSMDNQTADKAIVLIRQTGKKLKKVAHLTACGILLHWKEHGDWTKLLPLLDAVAEGMSRAMRQGLIDWVEAFSTLRYDQKNNKFNNHGHDRQFNLEGNPEAEEDTFARKGALNMPFYSGSFGDKPVHTFDLEKAFQAFLDRVHREMKRRDEATKAEAKRIKIDDDVVARIDRFAASIGVVTEKTEKQAA